jgi:hypothetical protein
MSQALITHAPIPRSIAAAVPKKKADPRIGLYNSAGLATLLAVIGHAFLGFEQSIAQMFVALAAGYSTALILEAVDATSNDRPILWRGGLKKMVLFLLPSHMTAITTSFLIFVSDRYSIMVFTVVLAVASKYLFKVQLNGRKRHFMNPSNFGIAATFVVFPWVGLIPYEYTTHTYGIADWIVPGVIVMLGFRLNYLFTKRLTIIASWLGFYVLQAVVRSELYDLNLWASLMPMTGVAFLLFTFYMITDPMTSPRSQRGQFIYGGLMALVYGLIKFGWFFAVTIMAAGRGALIAWDNRRESAGETRLFLDAV